MKKRYIAFVCIFCALMLTACGEINLNLPKRMRIIRKQAAEEKYDIPPEDLSGIENDIMLILTSAPAEFLGGYAVDEGFLLYVGSVYGKEALGALAQEMKTADVETWYNVTGRSLHVLMSDYYIFTGVNASETEKVYYKECAAENDIVMAFTGDINLGEGMGTVKWMDDTERSLSQCFDSGTFDELTGADILVINNECALSTKGSPLPGKPYTFEGDPGRVQNLLDIGVDMAGIANNHIYDFGEEALLETIEVLRGADIPFAGAGKDIEEASAPVYFIADGRKISVVAATQIERSLNYTKEATEDSAGVLKSLRPERTVEVIKEAKAKSDYCIVFIHWGTEGDSTFGADQKSLAVQFEKAGADAIIGGHTHCLQGMGFVDSCPVVYSLGNFWFSSTGNMPADYDTGIAKVTLAADRHEVILDFVPCRFSGGIVSELRGAQAQSVYDFLTSVSDGATVGADGRVEER